MTTTPAAKAARRPVTLEEKRARQRAYVKKSYYRQQSTAQELKEQVRQLEDEYQRLEAAIARDNPHAIDHSDTQVGREEERRWGDATSAAAGGTSESLLPGAATEELTGAYAQLTLLKERLRRENLALTDATKEHDKFQNQLGLWLEAEKTLDTNASSSVGIVPTAPRKRPPPPPVVKVPFTVAECQQLAASCYAEVRAFLQSNPFESTGANVFGWRDERRVLDGGERFDFSLKKFFYGHTAAELSLGGWKLNSTPRLRDFYAKSIDMDVHVLQEVDADNVIMFRVVRSADGRFADNTLFLTTRMRVETGYVILFRSLDHEGRIDTSTTGGAEKEPDDNREPSLASVFESAPRMEERWRALMTWVLFDEAGENGEHCLFHFGGMVPRNLPAWMLEILLVALRWESIVIGPVFSIC